MTLTGRLAQRRPAASVESLWLERDGVPLDMLGRSVSVVLIFYILVNRVISDRYVFPVGFSIRFHEVVLMGLALLWIVWILSEPFPFPTGLVGLYGLALFAILGIAPFLHGLTATSFQANGAERGLVRLFTYTAMVMAAFHLSFRREEGFRILGWLLFATSFQAAFGIYEFITKEPVVLLDRIAQSIGLILDPNSLRDELVDVFTRNTGEIRAAATAPHPIVLSAVIALGVLVAATWLLYAKRGRQTYSLVIAAAVLVLALPAANSRTAFVILGVAAIPFALLHVQKLPAILAWSLPAILAIGMAFAISPETPRLLLNSVTNADEDQNTQIRIDRFSRVPELLEERPVVGAGYLTHDPEVQIFDNAYNRGVIEFGVLGFVLYLAFMISSTTIMWRAAGRAPPPENVLPAVGVMGSIALLAGSATFDALTFDQFFPTCLILIGIGLGRSMIILRRPQPTGAQIWRIDLRRASPEETHV